MLKTKKIIYITLAWICGISVSLLFVFLAAYMVAFNRSIYHNSMVREARDFYGEKNLTDEQVRLLNTHDLNQKELDFIIDDVLKYLTDKRPEMNTVLKDENGGILYDTDELFTETEISHMVDVKALFTAIKWITVTCAILAPAALAGMIFTDRERWRAKHRNLFKYTLIGNGVFLGLLVLLMLINFEWAFEQFHLIFFNNMDWQLSYNDLLIEMLPENLFMRLAILISATYISLMAVFFFAGFFQKQIGTLFQGTGNREQGTGKDI